MATTGGRTTTGPAGAVASGSNNGRRPLPQLLCLGIVS